MVQHIYAATAMDSSSVWEAAPEASASAAPTMTLATILTMSSIFLMFVIFALVLIFLQYYYNAGVRRTAPSGDSGVAPSAGRRDKGVDPELLRSLPVTVYYRAAAPSAGEDDVGVECAVCLSQLEDGEEARFLPRCGHGFHAECVDMWLSSHSTCPLCRVTVAKPDASLQALTSTGLLPVPAEPAHYAANLPASVLLGVSDQATLAAASDGGRPRPSALATAPALVIEIPEPATPRDAAKTPGSARLRSLKRLWSFGGQGPSCSWGTGGRGAADTELRGISSACATPRAPVLMQPVLRPLLHLPPRATQMDP